MHAVEFTADLGSDPILIIPQEAAAQLPKSGKARIIILPEENSDDAQWWQGAYEQFMRDNAPEDEIYDTHR